MDVIRETIFDDDHVGKSSMNDDSLKLYGFMEDVKNVPSCEFPKIDVIVFV